MQTNTKQIALSVLQITLPMLWIATASAANGYTRARFRTATNRRARATLAVAPGLALPSE